MDVADGIFPESVPEAWPAAQGAGAGDRGDGLPAGRLGAWDGRAVGSRGKPESGSRAGRLAEERGADEKALEAYEEERRLFYVGITRAKDELHIFGINQKSTFRQELFAQAKYQKFHAAIGEGLIVRHRKFGEGVVVEAGEKQVVILFGNRQRKMDLRTLYENDLLVL